MALIVVSAWLLSGCTSPTSPAPEQATAPSRQGAIPTEAVKIEPSMDALPPILHSNDWDEPVPLDEAINTAGAEDSPFITADGNTLYFFFTPDPSVPPEKQLLDRVTGIYASHKQNRAWSPAERVVLQDPGKLALDGCPFVQGTTLWFCSAREGYNGISLFTAELREGKWGGWKYAGDLFKNYEVGEMHLTQDGSELYFHSPRAGGKGDLDIWVMRKSGDQWTPLENVTAVNTPAAEGWPYVTPDGQELWLTRVYQGSPAIFRSTRLNGQWAEPELIVSQFAGESSLDEAGNLYFVHHFYREGKMIEADIYVAYRRDSLTP